ncbi:hypothetical protein HDU76_006114 [Blyttiomyces sp. JEL0837]|nr:hypothetical protein HDU76_006114 [Blyttiomyces sp. JEL0837]
MPFIANKTGAVMTNRTAGKILILGGSLAMFVIVMIMQNLLTSTYPYQTSCQYHESGHEKDMNKSSTVASADSTKTCDLQFVFDEVKFDHVPNGDNWQEHFFANAKKDVAAQSAPMYCDLSKLELPMHITKVVSGDVSYKAALHPPTDIVSESLRNGHPFEGHQHVTFRARVRAAAAHTGKTDKDKLLVIDAGGNIGSHTLFLGSLKHEVHTFEPFSKNMNLLRCSQLANKFDNIFLQRVALSNETSNSKKCINLPPGNVGGSTLSDECFNDDVYTVNSMDIRTILLDDYWSIVLNLLTVLLRSSFTTFITKNTKPQHFMKIDIEGYEMKAFLGASKMLQHSPPYFIVSEILYHGIILTGFKPIDYISHMKSFGYTPYSSGTLELYDTINCPNDDVIFVHKDILHSPVANLTSLLLVSKVDGHWVSSV